MATVALIGLSEDDVEVIQNVISADPSDVSQYLVENGGDYDYAVDITDIHPSPDMGWVYDPYQGTFTDPNAEMNAEMNLVANLEAIHEFLLEALSIAGPMSPEEISSAISIATGAVEGEFTTNEADLYSAICSWVSSGG